MFTPRWSHLIVLVLTSAVLTVITAADPREIIPLTTWSFSEETTESQANVIPPPSATALTVTVPHIFRQSGLPDNAAGWYHQNLTLSAADRDRRILLRLDGAATATDVFVNGTSVGRHLSPYTSWTFDLTPALVMDKPNHLAVRVSNRDQETKGCFARSTLYYVNGGLFRPAWLIKTGAVHIAPDQGSSGVYLTPTNLSATRADLAVKTLVRNPLTKPVVAVVRHQVSDPSGQVCATFDSTATVPAEQILAIEALGHIAHPKYWDLGQANLYHVRSEIIIDNQVCDVVTEHTGFRTITYRDKHFQLNGRETQFHGVNKHAQNEYVWNAVSDEDLRWEWQMMADAGINAVRLAHYPHSQVEYDLADERGIAVWAENGYAGHAWKGALPEDKAVTPDGERLTRELVRQNWNHPSILFWSCGNETMVDTAGHYAEVIRQEDTPRLRLVTYATNAKDPDHCDFVAKNTYDGWYGGHFTGFAQTPKNSLISETGCGGWITHHIPRGSVEWKVDKYEPEEYSELFTEFRLQTICRDDAANRPMFFWWTFREFYDHKFKQNRNTKGLLTMAGMPKDMFYAFQAFLNPTKPVVHLNGRHQFFRRFAVNDGIKAYANVPNLELILNGVSQGRLHNGSYRLPDTEQKSKDGTKSTVGGIPVANVFLWKIPLVAGRNIIQVNDGAGHGDRMVIYQQIGEAPMPVDAQAVIQELHSSNQRNPAIFIDRPIEAQGPIYTDVDGSSDNTFDTLPESIQGSAWIATRRLSDEPLVTDLSFSINPASHGATVSVLHSTGTFPIITLKKPDDGVIRHAEAMAKQLVTLGFVASTSPVVWRDHQLNRAHAALWTRTMKPGETLTIPGRALDYVILIKPLSP